MIMAIIICGLSVSALWSLLACILFSNEGQKKWARIACNSFGISMLLICNLCLLSRVEKLEKSLSHAQQSNGQAVEKDKK